jgi:hypothetical protein
VRGVTDGAVSSDTGNAAPPGALSMRTRLPPSGTPQTASALSSAGAVSLTVRSVPHSLFRRRPAKRVHLRLALARSPFSNHVPRRRRKLEIFRLSRFSSDSAQLDGSFGVQGRQIFRVFQDPACGRSRRRRACAGWQVKRWLYRNVVHRALAN